MSDGWYWTNDQGMTVCDLIEALKTLPPATQFFVNVPSAVYSGETDHCQVLGVSAEYPGVLVLWDRQGKI